MPSRDKLDMVTLELKDRACSLKFYGFEGPHFNAISNKKLIWVAYDDATDNKDGTYTMPRELAKEKGLIK